MLKMKIQAMCWVTSSKVATSNVKHKSGRIIGLAHPARVPAPTPIYKVSVPIDKNFDFWIPSQTIPCDHSFESSCCTDFKNVIHYLIYTPWKLSQHFECWVKNDSRKEKLAIAFRLQARLSLKLLNSSENGCCFNTLDESFKRNWAAQF